MSVSDIGGDPNSIQSLTQRLHDHLNAEREIPTLEQQTEDLHRRLENEVTGFFPVAGHLAMRALRGVADSAVNTIDTATRGYSLLFQHASNVVQGLAGVPEAKRRLPNASGAVEWMTGHPDADTLDVAHTLGVIDDAGKERQMTHDQLQEWEMPAALAGELASFAIPGHPTKWIGEGVNNLVRNSVGLALPANRYLARMVKSGEMTKDEAISVARSGKALLKIAERENLGPEMRALAMAGDVAPDVLGEYTALIAQTYASSPKSEAGDAALHTAVMGPLFVGLGRGAKWVSSKLLDSTLSKEGKEALFQLHAQMNNGRKPGLWRQLSALSPADRAKAIGIDLFSTTMEATGFTAVNKDSFENLLDAFAGKPGSWSKFLSSYAGTLSGLLLAKGVSNSDLPYFRRLHPEFNSIQLEMERRAAIEQQKRGAMAEREDVQRRGTEAGQLIGAKLSELGGTAEDLAKKYLAIGNDAAVKAFVDPMLRSGWAVEDARVDQPIPEIKLNTPDGHAVTVRVPGPGNAMLDVSPSLWRIIRPGMERPDGPLTGGEAASFLTDLGLRGSVMQMRGTLTFGRLGFLESQAGQTWRDPETGFDYAYGLDGNVRRRPFGETQWQPVPKDDPTEWLANQPVGERLGEQSWWHPQMDEWANFASQKSRAFPDEFDDVLAMAINTAQYGGNTKNADELRNFFLAVHPAQLAQVLAANNQKVVGHLIASIGGGLSNHVEAQRLLQSVVAQSQRARTLALPESTEAAHADEPAAMETPPEAAPQEPQAATPPEQAGSSDATLPELYGGIPLKQLIQLGGKALKGFAELATRGDTSFGAMEGRMVPSREDQPDRPPLGTYLLDRYSENLPDAVGKYGGEVGQEFRQRAIAGNEKFREVSGKLEQAKYHEAVRRAEGRGGYRQAKSYLEEPGEAEVEGYRTPREALIIEGRMPEEGLSPQARTLLSDYREFRSMMGKESESVQTVKPNREGKHEYFRDREEAKVFIRSNMSDAYRDAFARPYDPRNVEILRKIAAHPWNGMDPARQEAWVKHVQSESDRAGGDESLEGRSATEVLRTLRHVPGEVQLKSGDWVTLRDPSAARALNTMVASERQGIAARAAFGQDLPEAAKKALNYGQPGPTEMMRRYREASGDDRRAENFGRKLLRRFEGLPEPGLFKQQKGALGLAQRGVSEVERTLRSAQISGAYKQNLVESVATNTHLAGLGRTLYGMLRAGFHPIALRRAALESGAILRDLHGVDLQLSGGFLAGIRKALGFLFRPSQGFAEIASYATGESAWRAMKGGGEVAKERARLLGFSEPEIDQMVKGEQDLHSRFVHAFVQETTAAKTPTEGSEAAFNPKWRSLRAFDSWNITRIRSTLRVGNRLYEAWKPGGTWGQKLAATRIALAFAGGGAASGLLANLIAMTLREQSFGKAWDHLVRDVENDGLLWGLTKMGLINSIAGGTMQGLYRAVFDKNLTAAERVTELTTPSQRGVQLWQLAMGEGPYQDQGAGSRIITAAERFVPAARDMAAVASAVGLAEQTDPFFAANAAKNKVLADQGKLPHGEFEPKDPQFSAALRSLRDTIREHSSKPPKEIVADPDFQHAMREALQLGTGKDIERGLMARRVLDGMTIEDLGKMRTGIGDVNMNVLYAHDEAMRMIAHAFAKKAGTEREVFPKITERLEEAERQAALGAGPEVWRQIHQQVVDEASEAIKAGGRPTMDIRWAARAMAQHVQDLAGVVGDRQFQVLRRASQPRAAELLELFMLDTARGRVLSQRR